MLNTLGREAETVVVEKEQKGCPRKSVKPSRVTSELHGFSYPTGFEPAPMEVESMALQYVRFTRRGADSSGGGRTRTYTATRAGRRSRMLHSHSATPPGGHEAPGHRVLYDVSARQAGRWCAIRAR